MGHLRFCVQNLTNKNPIALQLTLLQRFPNLILGLFVINTSKLSKILLTITLYSQRSAPSSVSTNNNFPSSPPDSQKFSSIAYKTSEARL